MGLCQFRSDVYLDLGLAIEGISWVQMIRGEPDIQPRVVVLSMTSWVGQLPNIISICE